MTHEEKITYWEAKADEACARYDRLCDRYGDISTNDNCDKLNENIEFSITWSTDIPFSRGSGFRGI